MIDFDESLMDVLTIFAVTGGDMKRVEVNERKMTEESRKLTRRAKDAELQSWTDHSVFDAVNKKVADKDRVMRARLGVHVEVRRQSQGTPLGFQDPDQTESSRERNTFSSILQGVASNKWKQLKTEKAGKQQRYATWSPLLDDNNNSMIGWLVKEKDDLSNNYPGWYVFDDNLSESC